MRVFHSVNTLWTLATVTAATLGLLVVTAETQDGPVAGTTARFVVLGVDGKVVLDADPMLYMPTKLLRGFATRSGEHYALPSASNFIHNDRVALSEWREQQQQVNTLHDHVMAQVQTPAVQEAEEDEFSSPIAFHLEVHPLEIPSSFFLDSEVPAVQGSIVFAELSCVFVAFIGYLVHSIRLWSGFSPGQKCCLSVVFVSASLYQVAVLAWYLDLLSPDAVLGLSSLITRMISLGMVPITTTSFMGRAREICADQHAESATIATSSSSSRSSRRRNHQRARYS